MLPEILGNEKQRRASSVAPLSADFNVPSVLRCHLWLPNLCRSRSVLPAQLCNSLPNQTFGEGDIGVCHVGDGFRALDRPGRRHELGLGSLYIRNGSTSRGRLSGFLNLRLTQQHLVAEDALAIERGSEFSTFARCCLAGSGDGHCVVGSADVGCRFRCRGTCHWAPGFGNLQRCFSRTNPRLVHVQEAEASHSLSLLHVIIKINRQLVDLPGELGTHFCCYHRMQRSGHVRLEVTLPISTGAVR